MTKNKDSTRYFSTRQEESVCKVVNGHRTANSGAGLWNKSDVYNKEASLCVECKTPMSEKNSFSIKKEWIEKNRKEAKDGRFENPVLAFNFEPDGENFFVIDEKLMRFLVEKLEEYNQ